MLKFRCYKFHNRCFDDKITDFSGLIKRLGPWGFDFQSVVTDVQKIHAKIFKTVKTVSVYDGEEGTVCGTYTGKPRG